MADEYAAMDTIGKGTITCGQLRRLIDRYALPVSDEHFEKYVTKDLSVNVKCVFTDVTMCTVQYCSNTVINITTILFPLMQSTILIWLKMIFHCFCEGAKSRR